MDSYWQWNKENYKWHYDPSCNKSDVQYVGRFITDPKTLLTDGINASKSALDSNDKYDEVSIKGTPYNKEAAEIMEGYHNDLTLLALTNTTLVVDKHEKAYIISCMLWQKQVACGIHK